MRLLDQLYDAFVHAEGIVSDTRSPVEGKVFFALRGATFDGNRFAESALAAGARVAVVDDMALRHAKGCIYVPNTLSALHRLAHHHRNHLDIPVLGITGSNGKTTTKELLRILLSQRYRVRATHGNLNNHIGVPMTLLALGRDTEFAIVEMGANAPGEIAWLAEIAAPTAGLITNIGAAHLEGFGSVEGVRQTKLGLYRYLERNGGTTFWSKEEPSMFGTLSMHYSSVVQFDRRHLPGQTTSLKFDTAHGFIVVLLKDQYGYRHNAQTHLYGAHNCLNILAAVAIAGYYGVTAEEIVAGLQAYVPDANRSQLIRKGSTYYYLDAYNANPVSMKAGLEHFASVKARRKIAVLGDMLELGDSSANHHRDILGQALMVAGLSSLVLVGPSFAEAAAMSTGATMAMRCVDTAEEARAVLLSMNLVDCHIYIKGSRSMRLENVLP